MIDAAVRTFLLAISTMITAIEPAADQGGGGIVRAKSANVCVQAVAAPVGVLSSPEPVPVGAAIPPSASPTNDRAWLIRAAATSQGVKLLDSDADSVDVRIFF